MGDSANLASDVCIMCDQAAETTDHLLLGCVVARQIWFLLLSPAGLQALVPDNNARLTDWWLQGRRTVCKEARRPFDALVLLVAWSVWKERNNTTFLRGSSSPEAGGVT
jgi:hypothetical protein